MKKSAGFTLIEVVIAVAILGIVIATAYGSMRNVINSKEFLDDGREVQLIADSIISRFVRELQLAYDNNIPLPPSCTEQDATPLSSSVSFIGKRVDIGDKKRGDTLRFLASEAGQYLPDGGGHSGVVQVSYALVETPPDEDPEKKYPYTLVREEVPLIKPIKRACERRLVFPITKSVTSLEFAYFDDDSGQWLENWEPPNREHTPRLVRFTFEITSPKGRKSTLSTVVPIQEGSKS